MSSIHTSPKFALFSHFITITAFTFTLFYVIELIHKFGIDYFHFSTKFDIQTLNLGILVIFYCQIYQLFLFHSFSSGDCKNCFGFGFFFHLLIIFFNVFGVSIYTIAWFKNKYEDPSYLDWLILIFSLLEVLIKFIAICIVFSNNIRINRSLNDTSNTTNLSNISMIQPNTSTNLDSHNPYEVLVQSNNMPSNPYTNPYYQNI